MSVQPAAVPHESADRKDSIAVRCTTQRRLFSPASESGVLLNLSLTSFPRFAWRGCRAGGYATEVASDSASHSLLDCQLGAGAPGIVESDPRTRGASAIGKADGAEKVLPSMGHLPRIMARPDQPRHRNGVRDRIPKSFLGAGELHHGEDK